MRGCPPRFARQLGQNHPVHRLVSYFAGDHVAAQRLAGRGDSRLKFSGGDFGPDFIHHSHKEAQVVDRQKMHGGNLARPEEMSDISLREILAGVAVTLRIDRCKILLKLVQTDARFTFIS